ncbi:MAG: DUF72 domain-containing protein [Desulfobacteraceae bacterium]|nr:MAG: DUF72 domain-containing protein [Desulfobacteraceae bacterium]
MEQQHENECRIFTGTSGYSYAEWIDAGFYPKGTHSSNMLPEYARFFTATELNYTWYQMPKAPAVERMRTRVPHTFRFAAKLTRTMTHEIKPESWKSQVTQYRQGISPLIRSGQLLTVLIQLPPYFTRTPEHRSYLAALLDELADLPLAVEFRHDSWACDKVLSELERRKVTLVAVDEPSLPHLFPALDAVTNPDLFYVRFHGRNAKGWRSGNMQKQFDYDYADTELEDWITRLITPMIEKAETGGIFFNNHVRGQAPKNALRLIAMLVKAGKTPTPETGPDLPSGILPGIDPENRSWKAPSST